MPQPTRLALLIWFGFLLVHLAVAASLPLIEDEAYYRLWATQPAWGYYDHPPMIAWQIAAGTFAFGETSLGVRVIPVFAYALAGLAVWDMTRRLAAQAEALWALLFFNCSLLTISLGLFATPDAPSVAFWALTLWAAIQALQSKSLGWWALAGLLCGLGFLSKLTNLLLAFGLVFWLLVTRAGRNTLASVGPWLSMLCALVVMSPYLIWNIANGWEGLERQLSRVQSAELNLLGPLELLAISALLIGPLILWITTRAPLRADPGRQLILLSLAPVAAYLLYHATHSPVAANWQAPLHMNIAVLAGLAAPHVSRRLRALAAGSALGLGVIALAVLFKPGTPWITGHVPPNQIRGWSQVHSQLRTLIAGQDTAWIATADYGLTASFWHILPDQEVWSVTEPKRYRFRPAPPRVVCDTPAILILRDGADSNDIAELFSTLRPIQTLERTSGEVILFRYHLFYADGYKGDCAET